MQRHSNPVLDEIEPEIVQMLESFGCELVLAKLKGPPGAQTLTLLIDKPGGVDSSECADMVKKVRVLLETLDSGCYQYNIVVSSPGIDRPLTKEEDFERFCGKRAKLRVQRPQGRQTLTGVLRGLGDGCVVIQTDAEAVEVPVTDLISAHLEPDW